MNYQTIPEMFLYQCNKFQNRKPAYLLKKDEQYTGYDYSELLENVECFALGLMELGVRQSDRIGLVAENSIDWIISDFAITGIGAVNVPLFTTLTSKQEEYIFNDCNATAIIVSNNFQLNKILEFKDKLESLRHVIIINDSYQSDDIMVKTMSSVIKRGKDLKTEPERKLIFENAVNKVKPDDLLTLIYTSGTTGNPKGVMLTHKNLLANLAGIRNIIPFGEQDTFLSFLPMCHAYERATGYLAAFEAGSTTALAESIETVAANILEVRPTLITTIPKLLETIRKKAFANIDKESKTKQKIFHWAINIGKAVLKAKESGKMPFLLSTKHKIADSLVFSKIREKTGGRLRMFVSGGAALAPEVCEFFLAIGITVLEGYGLTEASPVIAANSPENIELGTVGTPLFNVEVKLAEDGEILVRGDNVMKGYWNDKTATEEAIDENGWLYTGDIGMITEKGNLKITDRKKSIIVNSGGKNIAPQPIENLLSQSPYVDHCILIGDKRDYITALITPDFAQIALLAETFGIPFTNPSELISNEKIIQTIKNDIDRLQKDHAKFERVRKFSLLSEPFTIENGELTPKLSIKRHVVERKFSFLIDQMYNLSSEQ